jgi:hypothetical protein
MVPQLTTSENVTGLLTELAADGFERPAEAMGPTRVKNAADDLEAIRVGIHTVRNEVAGTFSSDVA